MKGFGSDLEVDDCEAEDGAGGGAQRHLCRAHRFSVHGRLRRRRIFFGGSFAPRPRRRKKAEVKVSARCATLMYGIWHFNGSGDSKVKVSQRCGYGWMCVWPPRGERISSYVNYARREDSLEKMNGDFSIDAFTTYLYTDATFAPLCI